MELSRLIRPRNAVAINLRYDRLDLYRIWQGMTTTETVKTGESMGRAPLWNGNDTAPLRELVSSSLRTLPDRCRWMPVQIALPDPVVRTCTMELQQWPRRRTEQHRFADWLASERMGHDSSTHALTYQVRTTGRRKWRLAVCTAPRAFVEGIEAAVRDAGLGVSLIDAAAHFRGRYSTRGTPACSGAVHADRDYLSIVSWDRRGALVHMSGRWHWQRDDAIERLADRCAEEIERKMRLHPELAALAGTARFVLEGDDTLLDSVAPLLEARFGDSFVRDRNLNFKSRQTRIVRESGNPGLVGLCW